MKSPSMKAYIYVKWAYTFRTGDSPKREPSTFLAGDIGIEMGTERRFWESHWSVTKGRKRKGAFPAVGAAQAKARRSQTMKLSEHCKSLRTGEASDTLRCRILEDPISWNSRVLGSHGKVLIGGRTKFPKDATYKGGIEESLECPCMSQSLSPSFLPEAFIEYVLCGRPQAGCLGPGTNILLTRAWGDQPWEAVIGLCLHLPSSVTWKRLPIECQMCTCRPAQSHKSLWKKMDYIHSLNLTPTRT